jgi:tight adherence protein C
VIEAVRFVVALVAVGVLIRQARRTAARERLVRSGVRPRPAGRRRRPLGRVLVGRVSPRGDRSLGRVRRRRAQAALGRELPVAVELVRMGVGAGLTPADALALVAGSRLGVGRQLAEAVAADVAAGLTFREAGRRRAAAAGDDGAARLVELLSDGQRSGAPLGHALGVLAAELRAAQRRQAEERARAVPVKLLFPLVFLALPAFVLLTVAPAVLVAFGR